MLPRLRGGCGNAFVWDWRVVLVRHDASNSFGSGVPPNRVKLARAFSYKDHDAGKASAMRMSCKISFVQTAKQRI